MEERIVKECAIADNEQVYNGFLIFMEDTLSAQADQNLAQYGLPQPNRTAATLNNQQYLRKTNNDTGVLRDVESFNEELLLVALEKPSFQFGIGKSKE